MPTYSFNVISNADIGLDPSAFSEGTYSFSAAPRVMSVTDDDGIFDDEASEDGQSHSDYQTDYETFDGTSQLMAADLDGMGVAGHIVQSVYKFDLYNATTGQSGTAYMIRVYNGTDPANFHDDWGGGQAGPYYYAFDIPVSPGDSFTFTNGNWRGQALYGDLAGGVPCFVAGTGIDTPEGRIAVERLRPGGRVRTQDNGDQILHWVGIRRLGPEDLARHPELRPVRIAAGALGAGLPERDLRVSPQHRMLVSSSVSRRMSGADEALVAAKHLVGLPGIGVEEACRRVTYVHFLCEAHQLVFAEGAATESLLPGAQALRSLTEAARAEIFGLFPELAEAEPAPVAARPLLGGRQGRRLAARHQRNGQALVQVSV